MSRENDSSTPSTPNYTQPGNAWAQASTPSSNKHQEFVDSLKTVQNGSPIRIQQSSLKTMKDLHKTPPHRIPSSELTSDDDEDYIDPDEGQDDDLAISIPGAIITPRARGVSKSVARSFTFTDFGVHINRNRHEEHYEQSKFTSITTTPQHSSWLTEQQLAESLRVQNQVRIQSFKQLPLEQRFQVLTQRFARCQSRIDSITSSVFSLEENYDSSSEKVRSVFNSQSSSLAPSSISSLHHSQNVSSDDSSDSSDSENDSENIDHIHTSSLHFGNQRKSRKQRPFLRRLEQLQREQQLQVDSILSDNSLPTSSIISPRDQLHLPEQEFVQEFEVLANRLNSLMTHFAENTLVQVNLEIETRNHAQIFDQLSKQLVLSPSSKYYSTLSSSQNIPTAVLMRDIASWWPQLHPSIYNPNNRLDSELTLFEKLLELVYSSILYTYSD